MNIVVYMATEAKKLFTFSPSPKTKQNFGLNQDFVFLMISTLRAMAINVQVNKAGNYIEWHR